MYMEQNTYKLLETIFVFERHFLKRCNFPLGVCVICLVKKI